MTDRIDQTPENNEKGEVLQFEGRYKGKDLILASAAVRTTPEGINEIEPGWFALVFIGSKQIRRLGKRLTEMKDAEEFMLYVQNPEIPKGSV